MSINRVGVEALGWVFAAEQPEIAYVRAEKLLPSGKLINLQGETVAEVCAAVDAWESYPVQAPNTRSTEALSAPAPAEPEAVEEAPAEDPPPAIQA